MAPEPMEVQEITLASLDHHKLAIVAIGRNEGQRLIRCLEAIREQAPDATVVYVDSGSTDGSVGEARERGAHVVKLDLSTPFTAGRARNAGFDAACQLEPEIDFIQFLDGDCELVRGWLVAAQRELSEADRFAAVCGRLRERHPDATIYNALADLEWDGPVGEIKSCGGNAMYRRAAFKEVGGFNAHVPAGEEPELCFRLRQAGWRIARIKSDMALHDAAMTSALQLWRRGQRGGHAYAQGAWMHGRTDERFNVRKVLSIIAWGGLGPAIAGAAAVCAWWWPVLALIPAGLLAVYVAQILRLVLRARRRGVRRGVAWAQGMWLVLGKFAELLGVLRFTVRILGRRPLRVIEHRSAAASDSVR